MKIALIFQSVSAITKSRRKIGKRGLFLRARIGKVAFEVQLSGSARVLISAYLNNSGKSLRLLNFTIRCHSIVSSVVRFPEGLRKRSSSSQGAARGQIKRATRQMARTGPILRKDRYMSQEMTYWTLLEPCPEGETARSNLFMITLDNCKGSIFQLCPRSFFV
jgi:hypothetical protein